MDYRHERKERALPKPAGPVPVLALPKPSGLESDWLALDSYLCSRLLSPGIAYLNGWYPTYDPALGGLRVVIPAVRRDGARYWQARDLTGRARLRYTSPKIARGDSVVWLRRSVPGVNTVVICEGPMDALAALGTGRVRTAVALMGATPSPDVWAHVLDIVRTHNTCVVLADSDAIAESTAWLAKLAGCCRVLYLALPAPGKKDFAEMTTEERKDALR